MSGAVHKLLHGAPGIARRAAGVRRIASVSVWQGLLCVVKTETQGRQNAARATLPSFHSLTHTKLKHMHSNQPREGGRAIGGETGPTRHMNHEHKEASRGLLG